MRTERTSYNPHTDAATTAEAYAAGRKGIGAGYVPWYDVRDALRSWRDAQDSCAFTSWYGADAIRRSRAYFCGLARYYRSGDASRFLAGVASRSCRVDDRPAFNYRDDRA